MPTIALTLAATPSSFPPSTRFDSTSITAIQQEDYTLGPGDRIKVDVLKAPQYTLDVVVIVTAETDTTIRIISMRKAEKNEQTIYYENR